MQVKLYEQIQRIPCAMSIVIAGERSGVGKTTITLAMLSYLQKIGLEVQSFKVGPDYIDPMFHRYVTGRPCRNLDPVLTSEAHVRQCFALNTQKVKHGLVEGVMGLFDGAAGRGDYASTAHIARLLNLPVLLVIDCSRMSHSIAALVHGYRSFDPRLQLAGVVLNRVGSDRHLELLKSALEPLAIPILGILHRHDSITIPDRHLGLVPTAELTDLNPLIEQLAESGETSFDWARLLPLLETTPTSEIWEWETCEVANQVPIAIAQDAAFSFYYQDNLDLLERLGGKLIPWSPLTDKKLPEGARGLYLGGGFPEMFAAQLSHNESARQSVYAAIQAGMPTYAECGGLMYLCQHIIDFEARSHPMVGILPTAAVMGKRLTLGYRQAIACQNSILFPRGTLINGHEFHRSYLTQEPDVPLYRVQGTQGTGYRVQGTESEMTTPHPPYPISDPVTAIFEGWHLPHLHASYIHLHWGATPEIPRRFLNNCFRFTQE